MKILIIEDQAGIRESLRDLLEINGHEVIEAEDGVEGLKRAAERPAFIFCDVSMPNLDGHGVLRGIRQMPEIAEVPFVFLTANETRDDQRAGMGLGADDYITKPFTEADILGAIAARTSRQQGVRERIQQLTDRHRKEVTARWSHELLTPLNAIMGSLELLELEADTIERRDLKEVLGIIRAGAVRQEKLSRKLIRYFNLEQQALAAPAGKSPRGRAEAAIEAGASQAAQEHGRLDDLRLALEPAVVGVSEEGLWYAASEIVGNAAAFSPSGSPITVTGTPQSGRYRLEITDQGPGMSAEQRAQAAAFVQFDRNVREQQGLGLGLAIARATARQAGGQMSLEAGPGGRGLRVVFDLPLATG